jgi:MobC-like protein
MKSRNIKISIRVSEIEQDRVAELAHEVSMSVSNYGRSKMLGSPVNQVIVPSINLETYRALIDLKNELRTIGNNLNQSVKWMHNHQAVHPSMSETIIETQDQIEKANQILASLQLASLGVRVNHDR